MKNIFFLLIIGGIVACCSSNLQTKNGNQNTLYKVLKIDSTKSMYLIQIQNNNIKELVLSERDCKLKTRSKNKLTEGKKYYLKIDPLDSYFNDDDFEKAELKVDDVNVKNLTQGTVYMSNNLCGLYVLKY